MLLGICLTSQRRFEEAETLLLDCHQALQSSSTAPSKLLQPSITALVKLYEAWDKPDQAAEWRQKAQAGKRGSE